MRRRATAVALALAVSACGNAGANSTEQVGPTPGPVAVDLDALEVSSLDLDTMPVGSPPTVPWIESQTLHTGSADVPLGAWLEDAWMYEAIVIPFGDGALRMYDVGGMGRSSYLDVLASDGSVVRSVATSTPSRSPDGSRVAWWEYDARELVVADTATGEEVERVAGPIEWAAQPWRSKPKLTVTVDGWLGSDDLLVVWQTYGANGREGVWRTSGKAVPSWFVRGQIIGYSPEAGLVLRTSRPTAYVDPHGDAACVDAVDMETSQLRWRHCYQYAGTTYPAGMPAFSPDGSHFLLSYSMVVDSATGQPTAWFDMGRDEGARYGYEYGIGWGPAFEDGEHFLAVVSNLVYRRGQPIMRNTAAIVRCDLDGRCELATDPVTRHSDWWQAPAYRLP